MKETNTPVTTGMANKANVSQTSRDYNATLRNGSESLRQLAADVSKRVEKSLPYFLTPIGPEKK